MSNNIVEVPSGTVIALTEETKGHRGFGAAVRINKLNGINAILVADTMDELEKVFDLLTDNESRMDDSVCREVVIIEESKTVFEEKIDNE